jgi:hypothetical protein
MCFFIFCACYLFGRFQDGYYDHFYVKACGGEHGMPVNYHPWRNVAKSARQHLGAVQVNLTFDKVITGYGGKGKFDLHYTCRHDLCAKKCK